MPKGKKNAKQVQVPAKKTRKRNRRKGLSSSQGKVSQNMAWPSGQSSSVSSRRSKPIEGDEFVSDILATGGANFATYPFAFNPGQSGTFPWASKEASLYEKYTVVYAQFYYKPMVSQFATNGQTGKVMLSFDYDASDASPATKQQVEDTWPHIDCMPYQECILNLDVKALNSQDSKYVRPGGLPGHADIKTYDGGVLSVSTVGIASNSGTLGELRVRYKMLLDVPVLENGASAPTNYAVSMFQSTGASEAAGATTVAKTLALATATVNGIGAVNATGVITLPVGNYLLDWGVIAVNNASGMTALEAHILVNGTAQAIDFEAVQVEGATGYITVNGTTFVSSTGATTVALSGIATYGAGAETFNGLLRIVSI